MLVNLVNAPSARYKAFSYYYILFFQYSKTSWPNAKIIVFLFIQFNVIDHVY